MPTAATVRFSLTLPPATAGAHQLSTPSEYDRRRRDGGHPYEIADRDLAGGPIGRDASASNVLRRVRSRQGSKLMVAPVRCCPFPTPSIGHCTVCSAPSRPWNKHCKVCSAPSRPLEQALQSLQRTFQALQRALEAALQ